MQCMSSYLLTLLKKMNLNYKPTRKDFFILCTCLVVITLPYTVKLNSISIILLTLSSILSYKTWKIPKHEKVSFILTIIFFLLYVLSLIYTENFSEGASAIEKRISFLLFPIIIGLIPKSYIKKKLLVKLFILSCFVGALLCLAVAFYRNISEQIELGKDLLYLNEWFFSYHVLSSTIGIHAIYFSVYCSFCLLALLTQILGFNKIVLDFNRLFIKFLICFLSIFIILLSSRIVIAVTLLLTLGFTFVFYFQQKKLWRFTLVFFGIIFFTFSFIFINPINKTRFQEALDLESTYSDNKFGGRDLRFMQWKVAWNDLIRNNLLIGIGPGDAREALNKLYKKYDLAIAYNYNLHNQYLDTLLTTGLIGLFVLLLLFYKLTTYAILNKYYITFSFIILIITVCLTESFFNLQKGIVFFTFFSCIFLKKRP